jgi:hypothetical protein
MRLDRVKGNETPYMETEALLALLNVDLERCQEILDQMLPGELRTLDRLTERLSILAERTWRRKEEKS